MITEEENINYKKILEDLEIHKEELSVQNEELKLKEVNLQKAYEDYFYLFYESPVAYIVINKNLEIIKYNSKANLTFQNNLDDPAKKYLIRYFEPMDLLKLKDWLYNEEETNKEYFVSDVNIDDKFTRFKIFTSPYKAIENAKLLTLIDIQDEHEMMLANKALMEEKDRQTQTILQQAKLATIGEMLGNIAHQWKQPLNTISMLISSAKLFLKKQDSINSMNMVEENIDKSLEQIIFLSDTVNNFNKFFLAQNVKETQFDLDTFFKNIETFTYTQFKDKNIKLIFDIKNAYLYGNQNQFTQVLLNIIGNAKDALVENNNENERYIFIKTFTENDNIKISITDCAGGIDESIKGEIFKQFFTTKDENKGTGLGLHLAKRIITEQFKGDICIENKKFKYKNKNYIGAEFLISIPKK